MRKTHALVRMKRLLGRTLAPCTLSGRTAHPPGWKSTRGRIFPVAARISGTYGWSQSVRVCGGIISRDYCGPPIGGPGFSRDHTPTGELLSESQLPKGITILKTFGKYLWPKGESGVKIRVGIALGLLVGSKVLNVQVPYLFKNVIDTLSPTPELLPVLPLAAILGCTLTTSPPAFINSLLKTELHEQERLFSQNYATLYLLQLPKKQSVKSLETLSYTCSLLISNSILVGRPVDSLAPSIAELVASTL